MSGAEPMDAPSDAGHTWGEARAEDAGDGGSHARSRPGAVAVQMAVRVLTEATEHMLMDTLEDVRLKARARLAALFAQSVAEGHQAYDADPVVGPVAFYDSALLAANLFPDHVVDQALAQSAQDGGVVDSSDSISDTPPEGVPAEKAASVQQAPSPKPVATTAAWSPQPCSKKATAKAPNPQQLHPRDARQPKASDAVMAVAPQVLKVEVTVSAEFQDVIATETYTNDPVLVAPKRGTTRTRSSGALPIPAHVQFGGKAPHPTAAAQQQVMVKNVPKVPVVPKATTAPPPTTSSSATTAAPAGAKPAGTTQHQFVRNPKATGNRADIPSGEPKATVVPTVWPPGVNLPPTTATGAQFATAPPDYWDITSQCMVRCPRCGVRPCGRVNRRGAHFSSPLPYVQGRRELRSRSARSWPEDPVQYVFFQVGAVRTSFCTAASQQNPSGRVWWGLFGVRVGLGFSCSGRRGSSCPCPFGPGFPNRSNPSSRRCAPHVCQCSRGGPCGSGRSSGRPGRWSVCFGFLVVSLPGRPPCQRLSGVGSVGSLGRSVSKRTSVREVCAVALSCPAGFPFKSPLCC